MDRYMSADNNSNVFSARKVAFGEIIYIVIAMILNLPVKL